MKQTRFLVIMVFLAIMAGCKNQQKTADNVPTTDTTSVKETYLTAIERFMTDSIGSQYAQGDVCIPFLSIVDVDESDADDIRVWGDFWVDNYLVSGDTLKNVSGGSHPGLMHVKQTADGFEVIGFDAVGDGSAYIPTAKKIFGERFDSLQTVASNKEKREAVRAKAIAEFVKRNDLKVTMYQDFGWDAVKIDL